MPIDSAVCQIRKEIFNDIFQIIFSFSPLNFWIKVWIRIKKLTENFTQIWFSNKRCVPLYSGSCLSTMLWVCAWVLMFTCCVAIQFGLKRKKERGKSNNKTKNASIPVVDCMQHISYLLNKRPPMCNGVPDYLYTSEQMMHKLKLRSF